MRGAIAIGVVLCAAPAAAQADEHMAGMVMAEADTSSVSGGVSLLAAQFGTEGLLTLSDLGTPSGTRSCLVIPWKIAASQAAAVDQA